MPLQQLLVPSAVSNARILCKSSGQIGGRGQLVVRMGPPGECGEEVKLWCQRNINATRGN